MNDSPSVSPVLLATVGEAIATGHVALWIGPGGFAVPAGATERELFFSTRWQAVWSRVDAAPLARALEANTSGVGDATPKLVVGPVDQELGEFSYGEVRPLFQLPEEEEDFLSQRDFVEKVGHLARLKSSVLVVVGYETADAVRSLARRYLLAAAPGLRIVVCDLPAEEVNRLEVPLPGGQLLAGWPDTLGELLLEVRGLAVEWQERADPRVLVGTEPVSLLPFRAQTPPIDQDFLIPTLYDTRPPEADEARGELFRQLVRGDEGVWRSFAHGLAWRRSPDHMEVVLVRLREAAKDRHSTLTWLSLDAEPASGCSTLLQQLAFEAARAGFPALLHRRSRPHFDAQQVQAFLRALLRTDVPALVLFDTHVTGSDLTGELLRLRRLLERESVRVVVVVAERRSGDQMREASRRRLAPLRSDLATERATARLAAWVRAHTEYFDNPHVPELLVAWERGAVGQRVPLLLGLDWTLNRGLANLADLGQHIVRHVEAEIARRKPPKEDRQETEQESVEARLKRWARGGHAQEHVTDPAQLRGVFLALSALGALNQPVPRSVLADILTHRAGTRDIFAVLGALDEIGLVDTDVAPAYRDGGRQWALIAAPAQYGAEWVRLRHAGYARLVFEHLVEHEDVVAAYEADSFSHEILAAARAELAAPNWESGVDSLYYPLRLLQPVLRRLKVDPVHVEFAEEASVALLRFHAPNDASAPRSLVRFQNDHPKRIRESLDAIPEQVVHSSDVVLHSRGMFYKAYSYFPYSEKATILEAGARDLRLAIEKAETPTGKEDPANLLGSLGYLYAKRRELALREGKSDDAHVATREALLAFLESMALRPNPFAAYGQAKILLDDLYQARQGNGATVLKPGDQIAAIKTVLELLQMTHDRDFAGEWEQMRRRALKLMQEQDLQKEIDSMIARRDMLGYALRALELLRGHVPITDPGPTALPDEALKEAHDALEAGYARAHAPSPWADLMRYAIHRTLCERHEVADYFKRYELLKQATQNREPRSLQAELLFDLGMLALQNGEFHRAQDWFNALRSGRRFLDVPLARSRGYVSRSVDDTLPREFLMRIVYLNASGTSWGRVPELRDLVPFSAAEFQGRRLAPDATLRCWLQIRGAGPTAVQPLPEKEPEALRRALAAHRR